MAGMRTQNFKKIVESRKSMKAKKPKTAMQKAQDSIDSAFGFRDRPEPKEEPIQRPGSAADAFTKSIKSRRKKK